MPDNFKGTRGCWCEQISNRASDGNFTFLVSPFFPASKVMFDCCIVAPDEAEEFKMPKGASRMTKTKTARKMRVKQGVRSGKANKKLQDGTVVKADGSKVLPDGTQVAAEAEDLKAREEKRQKQEALEAEAKAKKEAADEEHKRKVAEAHAEAERQAAERKKALEEELQQKSMEERDMEAELRRFEEELEKEEEERLEKERLEEEEAEEEWAKEMLEEMGYDEEDVQDLADQFRFFDKDGNGYIDRKEIGEVMRAMGEELDDFKTNEFSGRMKLMSCLKKLTQIQMDESTTWSLPR
eukprot:s1989_g12.t1